MPISDFIPAVFRRPDPVQPVEHAAQVNDFRITQEDADEFYIERFGNHDSRYKDWAKLTRNGTPNRYGDGEKYLTFHEATVACAKFINAELTSARKELTRKTEHTSVFYPPGFERQPVEVDPVLVAKVAHLARQLPDASLLVAPPVPALLTTKKPAIKPAIKRATTRPKG